MVVDGATSNLGAVVSGVPQGSVLGPLLFLIYINDITKVDLSPQSHRVLYCDNVLLYRGISQLNEDLPAVQSDINKLAKWSEEQLLQLNQGKYKYNMIISKKHRTSLYAGVPLCLGKINLEEVERFKYLGVLVNNNLT